MEFPDQGQVKKVRQFYLIEQIGKGSFGTVFRSKVEESAEEFAVKQIPRAKAQRDQAYLKALEEEIITLKYIKHPNIVRFVQLLITSNNYYLVTELCNQGSLKDYLNARPRAEQTETEALTLMVQIRDGFEELRAHKVTHNDFKAENVFLHNDVIKIGDFGSAVYKKGRQGLISGSPYIQAPELLYWDQFSGRKDVTDLWSIGCVFYYILFRAHPYPIDSLMSMNRALTDDEFKLDFPHKISSQLADLLTRLLQRNPDERIGWTDFFRHPAFEGVTSPVEFVRKPKVKEDKINTSKAIKSAISMREDKEDSFGFIHVD